MIVNGGGGGVHGFGRTAAFTLTTWNAERCHAGEERGGDRRCAGRDGGDVSLGSHPLHRPFPPASRCRRVACAGLLLDQLARAVTSTAPTPGYVAVAVKARTSPTVMAAPAGATTSALGTGSVTSIQLRPRSKVRKIRPCNPVAHTATMRRSSGWTAISVMRKRGAREREVRSAHQPTRRQGHSP